MVFSQKSIYRGMAAADLSLATVQMTPSQLVLMLSWDKEMPASSDFTLRWVKIWQLEQ
jgi:hypothetical protein